VCLGFARAVARSADMLPHGAARSGRGALPPPVVVVVNGPPEGIIWPACTWRAKPIGADCAELCHPVDDIAAAHLRRPRLPLGDSHPLQLLAVHNAK
jgi:hypothetical protein